MLGYKTIDKEKVNSVARLLVAVFFVVVVVTVSPTPLMVESFVCMYSDNERNSIIDWVDWLCDALWRLLLYCSISSEL